MMFVRAGLAESDGRKQARYMASHTARGLRAVTPASVDAENAR
jgi:hypothetical protein